MVASCVRSFFVQVWWQELEVRREERHFNVQLCVGIAGETHSDCYIQILAAVNYCLLEFFVPTLSCVHLSIYVNVLLLLLLFVCV